MKSVIAGLFVFAMSLSAQAVVSVNLSEGYPNAKKEVLNIQKVEIKSVGVVVSTDKDSYVLYQSAIKNLGLSSLEVANLIKENASQKGNLVISGSATPSSDGYIYIHNLGLGI